MGKIRELTALVRQKPFLFRLGAVFVAALGIASAVFGITGWHLELGSALIFGSVMLIGSAIVSGRHAITPTLSVNDVLAHNFDDVPTLMVRCPCDLKLSAQAKDIAKACFAGNATISPDVYEQLRVKNQYILACLTDGSETVYGYFDVIPLRDTYAQAFLRGLVSEDQMTHEDVLSPNEMGSCKYLYLSGIAVRDPETYAGRRNANVLVWAFLQYLKHFYGATRAFAFAIAVTTAGDELLAKFKLHLEAEAASRKDGYKLYSAFLNSDGIDRRLACLPDWTELCELEWSQQHGSRTKARRPLHLPNTKIWNLDEARVALRR
jgi:hypothetical protein